MRTPPFFEMCLIPAVLVFFGLGCTEEEPAVSDTGELAPAQWDEPAPAISCALDEVETPMLDAVLADAGLALQDVGFSETDWGYASYGEYLDDPFRLSWFREAISEPLTLSCRGGQVSADLDHAVSGLHPVASALGMAMNRLDHFTEALPQDAANSACASAVFNETG